jgi:hypothetical protein
MLANLHLKLNKPLTKIRKIVIRILAKLSRCAKYVIKERLNIRLIYFTRRVRLKTNVTET